MRLSHVILVLAMIPGAGLAAPREALDATAQCVADATGDTLANTTHQVEQVAAELEIERAGATEQARKAWAEFEEGTRAGNLDPESQCLVDHLVPYLEDPA